MASTVWKGQLSFGLVSMPVRLYRAARKERIPLHYLAPREQPVEEQENWAPGGSAAAEPYTPPDDEREPEQNSAPAPVSRVVQTLRGEEEQQPVARADLLRGHEVGPDQYVTFTQRELRALRPQTSSEMQIVRSVRLEEIDPVYFETSYYVVPDRGGERAYSLLFVALKESRFVALANIAMHGREHIVVIRPASKGLLAHTMFYQDEVRAENEFEVKISDVAPKELQLARAFVEAIAGPFAPDEFKDTHREKLQRLISAKLARSEVASAEGAAAEGKTKQGAPTLDILEALRKSLGTRPAPTHGETRALRKDPGRVADLKGKQRKRRA